MLAYNRNKLQNLNTRDHAANWLDSGIISETEKAQIEAQFPCDFYTPNLFIRITLFIATLLVVQAGFGFFGLMVGFSEWSGSILMLVYGAVLFFLLEHFAITDRKFFRAGMDDALLYTAVGFVLAGAIFLLIQATDIDLKHRGFLLALPLFIFAAIRYIDSLATLAALYAFGAFVFAQLLGLGGWMKAILPFCFMAISLIILIPASRKLARPGFNPWRNNLVFLKVIGLLGFYAAGNYFVVRELSAELLGLKLAPGEDIPLAPVFYILTAATPMLYLILGLRKRDVILIRVALLCVAASALTVRHYVQLAPLEIVLLAGGAFLIVLAAAVIRWLRAPVGGFTHKQLLKRSEGTLDLESYLIAETAPGNQGDEAPPPHTFGGGQSGGAGAQGEY